MKAKFSLFSAVTLLGVCLGANVPNAVAQSTPEVTSLPTAMPTTKRLGNHCPLGTSEIAERGDAVRRDENPICVVPKKVASPLELTIRVGTGKVRLAKTIQPIPCLVALAQSGEVPEGGNLQTLHEIDEHPSTTDVQQSTDISPRHTHVEDVTRFIKKSGGQVLVKGNGQKGAGDMGFGGRVGLAEMGGLSGMDGRKNFGGWRSFDGRSGYGGGGGYGRRFSF